MTQVRRSMRGGSGPNIFMGYAIRTEQWRYIEWDGGDEGMQLYNYEQDPQEQNNLAYDPEQSDRIAQMQRLLRNRVSE